jgi:hypothetical protein
MYLLIFENKSTLFLSCAFKKKLPNNSRDISDFFSKIILKIQIDTTRDKPQRIVGHSPLSRLQPPDASKSSAKDLSPSVHEKI